MIHRSPQSTQTLPGVSLTIITRMQGIHHNDSVGDKKIKLHCRKVFINLLKVRMEIENLKKKKKSNGNRQIWGKKKTQKKKPHSNIAKMFICPHKVFFPPRRFNKAVCHKTETESHFLHLSPTTRHHDMTWHNMTRHDDTTQRAGGCPN